MVSLTLKKGERVIFNLICPASVFPLTPFASAETERQQQQQTTFPLSNRELTKSRLENKCHPLERAQTSNF